MPEGRFDGIVAVVTGGSNGIGRAISQAFAEVDGGSNGGRFALANYAGKGGERG